MYLTRLELQGFKSFPVRTVFEFGPGVTAIIGPNGSGKSNVADALRWVLGESSARAMRLRRLEDALFAGGGRRPPAGFAEVSMWLDNADGWLPVEFAEVVVTRRLHRSGESEYLLNRRRVRGRDIAELFLTARLGQNSYAIMGQGLVDQVLSLRPAERRALIEEAADIRRYRVRIDETRERLVATRANLDKLRLLVGEIAPRLVQLERQARRADEHARLASALAEALHAWYTLRLRDARAALAAAQRQGEIARQTFEAAQGELAQREERLTGARARLAAARAEAEAAALRRHAAGEQLQAARHKLRLEEERLGFVRRRLHELDTEHDALQRERAELLTAPLPTLEVEPAQARAALEAAQESLRRFDAAREHEGRARAETEATLRRRRGDLRELEERLDRLARDLAAAEREAAGRAERRARLLRRLREYGLRFRACRAELLQAVTEREEAARRAADARRALGGAHDDLSACEREASERRAVADELARRLTFLRRLSDEQGGDDGALRVLLTAAARGEFTARGVLGGGAGASPLLRVRPGFEIAVEAALGVLLTALVVPSAADADTAVALLHRAAVGRTTVIDLSAVGLPPAVPPAAGLLIDETEGVLGPMSRFVECDDDLRGLTEALLSGVLVARDLAGARAALARGAVVVVTLDGTVLRADGTRTAGRAGEGGTRFVLARELDGLPARVDAARAAAKAAAAALTAARAHHDELLRVNQQLAAAAERAHRAAERAREALNTERGALAPISGELRYLRESGALVHTHVESLQRERERLLPERAALTTRLSAAEEAARETRRAGDAAAAQRESLQRAVAEARGVLAAAERGQQALAKLRESRAAALARLDDRLAACARESAGRRNEIAAVEADMLQLRETIARLTAAQDEATRAAAPARERVTALVQTVAELESDTAARRSAVVDLERAALAAESAALRHADEFARLCDEAAADGVALAPPEVDAAGGSPPIVNHGCMDPTAPTPAGASRRAVALPDGPMQARGAPPSEDGDEDGFVNAHTRRVYSDGENGAAAYGSPDALAERVRSLRARIRALGPVNPAAAAEYRENRERHDFLIAQIADLEAANATLRRAIDELRAIMRGRFDEAFARIGADFETFFATFFGGGAAQLVLTDAEGDGDAGVEIVARPPGKRLQSLALLSGGERAMTAVALLFALLQSNPAPFCVLDEVDAALDEANVGRFSAALARLAERTQFIVITHNRLTIEAAAAIYGVSMGRDGVSNLLSLRLEDVDEHVAGGG